MNTKECIAICVGAISAVALLLGLAFITKISDRVEQLNETLSEPGLTSEINIEHLTITTEDGSVVELEGFDADVNSRLIDLLVNMANQ